MNIDWFMNTLKMRLSSFLVASIIKSVLPIRSRKAFYWLLRRLQTARKNEGAAGRWLAALRRRRIHRRAWAPGGHRPGI